MPGWRTRSWRGRRRSPRGGRPADGARQRKMRLMYLKCLMEATPSGMAHWIATGPLGTVCAQCGYYGYGEQYANNCLRYYEIALAHGAAFPAETPSCKYFSPR